MGRIRPGNLGQLLQAISQGNETDSIGRITRHGPWPAAPTSSLASASVIFEEITLLEHGSWLPMALDENAAQMPLPDIVR